MDGDKWMQFPATAFSFHLFVNKKKKKDPFSVITISVVFTV